MGKMNHATVEPTALDIAWAAGFLEGEGSFGRNKGLARVKATQVDREPLKRLQALFGGSICTDDGVRRRKGYRRKQVLLYWSLTNLRAETLMLQLLPHMSARRHATIVEALNPNTKRWK